MNRAELAMFSLGIPLPPCADMEYILVRRESDKQFVCARRATSGVSEFALVSGPVILWKENIEDATAIAVMELE